ncbi:hypothetical protein TrCOL_g9593 [Triparma columacea]|jgi:hypothetical protein|uniref:Uncharacterized protein n=1 Tax=Triparma columacea TaxID=722753 RepID=A0A9W7FWK3_9STRA|nr:hypothetical protein TrCOL_g9593 [Triparma columacea]
MAGIIQPHSAHIWKTAIGLFVLGTVVKGGSYVLVKEDIQKRSAKETSNGRISLERAREPVVLSKELQKKAGVETSAEMPALSREDKVRMKEMLMKKYSNADWMKERKREIEYASMDTQGAVERGELREKLTKA